MTAVQEEPRGTGDAVRCAQAALAGAHEVLVLSGDTPLLTTELLEALLETHRSRQAGGTVLSFVPDDIRSYGRIVRDADGDLEAIVEAGDASAEQLEIREANSSIYVFRADLLWPAVARLQPANVQGELYLTDAVRDLVDSGEKVVVHVAPDPAETEGVNTRVELASAAAALRARINDAHMLAGVTIADPATTWIEPTVTLTRHGRTAVHDAARRDERRGGGRDRASRSRDRCRDRTGGDRRTVLLRSTRHVLGARSKAGTFVEIKNTRLDEDAKVPHLSYLGTRRSELERTSGQARLQPTSNIGRACRRSAP